MLTIQLVSTAARVGDRNGYDRSFAIVVAPMSDSSGQRDDVALVKGMDPLVFVSPLPLLLERLVRLWATRDHCSGNTPSCMQGPATTNCHTIVKQDD